MRQKLPQPMDWEVMKKWSNSNVIEGEKLPAAYVGKRHSSVEDCGLFI
jgi:hypothetical protein